MAAPTGSRTITLELPVEQFDALVAAADGYGTTGWSEYLEHTDPGDSDDAALVDQLADANRALAAAHATRGPQ